MAFVVGIVTEEEAKELESRGWKLEEANPHNSLPKPKRGERVVSVFVDNDMFSIMNGPDWEGSSPVAKTLDAKAKANDLLNQGFVQISARHRLVAALPPGKTGMQALKDMHTPGADAVLAGLENAAKEHFLRVYGQQAECVVALTVEEFKEFRLQRNKREEELLACLPKE